MPCRGTSPGCSLVYANITWGARRGWHQIDLSWRSSLLVQSCVLLNTTMALSLHVVFLTCRKGLCIIANASCCSRIDQAVTCLVGSSCAIGILEEAERSLENTEPAGNALVRTMAWNSIVSLVVNSIMKSGSFSGCGSQLWSLALIPGSGSMTLISSSCDGSQCPCSVSSTHSSFRSSQASLYPNSQPSSQLISHPSSQP